MYVTDKHGFLWFLSDDPRLGHKAREIFENADAGRETVIIPTIVLLESIYVCEEKRLSLQFGEVMKKIEGNPNYLVYPLDEAVVSECSSLPQIREMHDRVIIATSRQAGANANFVQILGADAIRIRTYERGVETETPACGTGATAAVVVAIESRRVKEGRVNVKCNGGNLAVTYRNSDAVLEGPAELSATQSIDL